MNSNDNYLSLGNNLLEIPSNEPIAEYSADTDEDTCSYSENTNSDPIDSFVKYYKAMVINNTLLAYDEKHHRYSELTLDQFRSIFSYLTDFAYDDNSINEAYTELLSNESIKRATFPYTPNIIVFNNGVFNVKKGKLKKHSPEYFNKITVNANYIVPDEDEPEKDFDEAPKFKNFIDKISDGDKEVRNRMLEFLAYCLLPTNPGKYVFVLGPEQNSGRSTLLNMLKKLVEDTAVCSVNLKALASKHTADALIHSQIGVASAVSNDDFNTATIKELYRITSEDTAYSSYAQGKGSSETFHTKIIMESMGHLRFDKFHTEEWNRLVIVPFIKSIPRDERKDKIKLKKDERDLVATVLANTAHKLYCNNFIFKDCPKALELKQKWIADSSPVVASFVKQCCIITNDNSRIHTEDLFSAFEIFCFENNLTLISKKLFSSQIKALGMQPSKWVKGKSNARGYVGIKLNDVWQSKINQ